MQVMGADQLHFLMGRFSDEALMQLVHQSEGKEPPDREQEEQEEEDEALARTSNSNSKSPAASFKSASSSSQKVGLKRKLQAMRGRDVLGSIFAWLLCMQRVDNGLDDDGAVRHLPAQVRDDAERHAPAAGLGQGPLEGQGPAFHKQQCFYPNMHVLYFLFF